MTQQRSASNVPASPIRVFGLGGPGVHTLNTLLVHGGIPGVDFIAADTSQQVLTHSLAPNRLLLGPRTTKGFGTGGNFAVGRAAAIESQELLDQYLRGAQLVFVIAGAAGGTVGAATVLASLAWRSDILNVGLLSTPFRFEGRYRRRSAHYAVHELQGYADCVIVTYLQDLLPQAHRHASLVGMLECHSLDLGRLIAALAGLLAPEHVPRIALSELRAVLSPHLLGSFAEVSAAGANRAAEATRRVIRSPWLHEMSFRSWSSLIVTVQAVGLTAHEFNTVTDLVQKEAREDAKLLFSASRAAGVGAECTVTMLAAA